jgi:hypothetical protein
MNTRLTAQKKMNPKKNNITEFLTILFHDFQDDIAVINKNYKFIFIKGVDDKSSRNENITGKSLFDIIPDSSAKILAGKLNNVFNTEKSVVFEMLYPSGKKILKFQHFIYPLLISKGCIKAVCLVSRNIDYFKINEMQLEDDTNFPILPVSLNYKILAD